MWNNVHWGTVGVQGGGRVCNRVKRLYLRRLGQWLNGFINITLVDVVLVDALIDTFIVAAPGFMLHIVTNQKHDNNAKMQYAQPRVEVAQRAGPYNQVESGYRNIT